MESLANIAFRHPALGSVQAFQRTFGFRLSAYAADDLLHVAPRRDVIALGNRRFHVSETEYVEIRVNDEPRIFVGGNHNAAVHFMQRYNLHEGRDTFLHVDRKDHPDNGPVLVRTRDPVKIEEQLASGIIKVSNYVTVLGICLCRDLQYHFLYEDGQIPHSWEDNWGWGGMRFATRGDISDFALHAGARAILSCDLDIFQDSAIREELYQSIAAVARASEVAMFFTSPKFNDTGAHFAERYLDEHLMQGHGPLSR